MIPIEFLEAYLLSSEVLEILKEALDW